MSRTPATVLFCIYGLMAALVIASTILDSIPIGGATLIVMTGAASLQFVLSVWLMRRRGLILVQAGIALALLLVMNALYPLLTGSGEGFKRHTPRISRSLIINGDVMPGFSGVQNVSTDSHGFRVSPPVDYDSKPAGTLRIFAIGAYYGANLPG